MGWEPVGRLGGWRLSPSSRGGTLYFSTNRPWLPSSLASTRRVPEYLVHQATVEQEILAIETFVTNEFGFHRRAK